MIVRIGTRGSPLALWQANHVAQRLRSLDPALCIELVEIQTTGDRDRESPPAQIGGQGVFTKEIQRAVLDRRADVAVHSLKDLPTQAVEGLTLAAVPARGPSGDAFISEHYHQFDEMPSGATVATGSSRRRAQLLNRRPDLRLVEIRGNVETRLRKLSTDNLDALILAEAGLERLELADRITEILDPAWMLPAVGQGALGLECLTDDAETRRLLEALDHAATRACVLAERALLRGLGGGCLVPIGAAAAVHGDVLTLRAAVLSPDGTRRVADEAAGSATEAEAAGERLAGALLARGARELLAAR